MAKIAVIGAGASGLTSVKACLEVGLAPTCFEKSSAIGGLWHYREKDNFADLACVFKSTTINTSKEVMAFSDFPPPKEYPNYMHNSLVNEYLKMYAEKFGVLKHIRFNTSVTSVARIEDSSGRWRLTVKNEDSKLEETHIFDSVMVCTGHHGIPHTPEFEGLCNFHGTSMHTHDYKTPVEFEDKRILVVGIGNSAADAAVDLSRSASKVYLSTRRGTWLMPRAGDAGLPGDLKFSRFLTLFPESVVNNILEKQLLKLLDHDLYGLRPQHRVVSAHPTVNDDLPNRIISGSVVIKPDIKRFTKTGVEFVDGSAEDIDALILGTGYVIRFPFLPENVLKVDENQVSLYKYVFPPDMVDPSLAIIGLAQPIGSTVPIAEMQARWAVQVFKGIATLPSKNEMLADIASKKQAMAKRYVASQRHTIQVDFLPYMDEIATEIGVKPDLKKLFWEDPRFWVKLVFGPSLNYQFRLVGPGKWDGAREAVESYWERVEAPFHSRKAAPRSTQVGVGSLGLIVMSLFILLAANGCLNK